MMKHLFSLLILLIVVEYSYSLNDSSSYNPPPTTMFGISFGNYSSFQMDLDTSTYSNIDVITTIPPNYNSNKLYVELLVLNYSSDSNSVSVFYAQQGYFRVGSYFIDNATLVSESEILVGKQLGNFFIGAFGYDPIENKVYGVNQMPFSILVWDLNALDYNQYDLKSNYTMGYSALDVENKLFYSLFVYDGYVLQVFNPETEELSFVEITNPTILPPTQSIYLYLDMHVYNGNVYFALLLQSSNFKKEWMVICQVDTETGLSQVLYTTQQYDAMATFFAVFSDTNYVVLQYGTETINTVVYDLESQVVIQKSVSSNKIQSGARYLY